MDFDFYPNTTDSHMHITEMEKKGLEVHSLLDSAFSSGLESAMDVAVDENHFDERLAYKKRYPKLLLSAGVHPCSSRNVKEQISIIEKQIANDQISAIGETGLDFHWDTVPADLQKEMFAAHIALSRKSGLPLIIHNRLADKEVLELLTSEKAERAVLHCYSSNYHFVKKFIDLGFFISFAGNVTYKKSEEIREAASHVPFDRILVETDAPYLSPQKKRGKLNHPGHLTYTIDCIADIFNKGADETAYQTYLNYRELYNYE